MHTTHNPLQKCRQCGIDDLAYYIIVTYYRVSQEHSNREFEPRVVVLAIQQREKIVKLWVACSHFRTLVLYPKLAMSLCCVQS